jgi:hypothetical protein
MLRHVKDCIRFLGREKRLQQAKKRIKAIKAISLRSLPYDVWRSVGYRLSFRGQGIKGWKKWKQKENEKDRGLKKGQKLWTFERATVTEEQVLTELRPQWGTLRTRWPLQKSSPSPATKSCWRCWSCELYRLYRSCHTGRRDRWSWAKAIRKPNRPKRGRRSAKHRRLHLLSKLKEEVPNDMTQHLTP